MNRRRVLALPLALCATAARADPAGGRLAGLPLTEAPSARPGDTLTVLYSGDGGWAAIDKSLADGLLQAGVPVVGIDSLRYFWRRRAPQEAADDLAAIIAHYTVAWSRSRVILAGYSFGADALPAIVPHLPPRVRAAIRLMALISPDARGELKFQPLDWLNHSAPDAFALAPLLSSLGDVPSVCIYGEREADGACTQLAGGSVQLVRLEGDHHFNGRYDQVARAILRAAAL